jgi:holo-[acyl-carrier protein] synthase
VDAVEIDRFRRVLARRSHLDRRLFTAAERAYAGRAADPVPRLATRFAAKEATMKALGVGLGAFPFTDVEVERSGLGVVRWHLSLTHTEHVALALVVAGADPAAPLPPSRSSATGATTS